jgi:hypothetical protein
MIEVNVTVGDAVFSVVVGEGLARADGAKRVSITRLSDPPLTGGTRSADQVSGETVGHGWWGGQRIEDCDAVLGDDVYAAIDSAVAAALYSTQVNVRDVASGDVHTLPGTTRCIPAPGALDEATGCAVQIVETDGTVYLRYTVSGGGRETLEAAAVSLVDSKPAADERLLVESTDKDDSGRPLWWLSEVVPGGFSASLAHRIERLHATGHAPPVSVALEAARQGRLWEVDTGNAGHDSILDADSGQGAIDVVADHAGYPRRLAHEGGVSVQGSTVRPWTATKIVTGGAS